MCAVPSSLICGENPVSSITVNGKELRHPKFIGIENEKIVVLHDEGIEHFAQTDEILNKLKITKGMLIQSKTKLTSYASYVDEKADVEKWLVAVKSYAQKNQPRNGKESEKKKLPKKTVSSEKEDLSKYYQKSFTATEFDKSYESKVHNGRHLSITGEITAFIDNGDHKVGVVLSGFVLFVDQYYDKIRARDISGNPKEIGNFKIGSTITLSGVCVGEDSEGYIRFR